MKRLMLVRHGKAKREASSGRDFDRPLSRRGEEDAPEMGSRLAGRGVRPEAVITSPAKRARSTARRIARALGHPVAAIREEDAIYDATVPTLLALVRSFDDEWTDVLLVGHNPGLEELASLFTAGAIDGLPTCAVVGLGFEVRRWREVDGGGATVLSFDVPGRPASSC
ncbi:MAG: histidine phosphatase family protein [Deltaproteobacteria bacterium]|nr:histidine phosphatase family protein [Deltaproteobacteria bacterium]